ncbi:hypothetical protein CDL12_21486 [Handroanthus impetiginosus]|uniref:Uncharacterized protein n=1 Tax=Handroanthus impetiginosus TaxID=429701 RepID=A0A2G9GL06_9LAMI|nr:hypothetical protein CDL12_21486 [Handroanthus impetiginosus]
MIHMISGGPTAGDSNRAKKAHARQGMTKIPRPEFSSADLEGADYPYQDALVITFTVATYDVARVFIDCESSVDILFLKASQQMDLGPIKM